MTRIDVAPDLVEEAVFLALMRAADRGDARALDWIERRERLYEIPDRARRARAFREHAMVQFRALRFDEPLLLALEDCPAVRRRLDVLVVRRARRSREERAELFCAPSSPPGGGSATRAVLALRPERFGEVEALFELVRRELLFVDDMLDESFAYAPDALDRLDLDPGQRDVVTERVGRAWTTRVQARERGEVVGGAFATLVQEAVGSLRTA